VRLLGFSYDVPRQKWRGGLPVGLGWARYSYRNRRAGLWLRLGTHAVGFAVVPKMKTA
jgi:hypothetical protein